MTTEVRKPYLVYGDSRMTEPAIADDTLEGSRAIASYIGKSQRRTEYLLETKQLPAFKIGIKWNMRKSTYRSHIERLEAATKVA